MRLSELGFPLQSSSVLIASGIRDVGMIVMLDASDRGFCSAILKLVRIALHRRCTWSLFMRHADCKVGEFGFSSVSLVKTVLACFRSLVNSLFTQNRRSAKTTIPTIIALQQKRCTNAIAKSRRRRPRKITIPCGSPVPYAEMRTWCLTSGFVRRIDPSLEGRGAKTYKPLMQRADSYSKDLHL